MADRTSSAPHADSFEAGLPGLLLSEQAVCSCRQSANWYAELLYAHFPGQSAADALPAARRHAAAAVPLSVTLNARALDAAGLPQSPDVLPAEIASHLAVFWVADAARPGWRSYVPDMQLY